MMDENTLTTVTWICELCGNDFYLTYANQKPYMWSGFMDCIMCKDDSDNLNKMRHAV